MINVSSECKNRLKNENQTVLEYADVTLEDGTTLNLREDDLWQGGMTFEDSVSADNAFEIGAAIINKCSIVLSNLYDQFSKYNFKGAKLITYVGVPLDDIDAGNTNLILKTKDFLIDNTRQKGWANPSKYTFAKEQDGFTVASLSQSGNIATVNKSLYSTYVEVHDMDFFTVSFLMKIDSSVSWDIRTPLILEGYLENGATIARREVTVSDNYSNKPTMTYDEWIEFYVSLPLDEDTFQINSGYVLEDIKKFGIRLNLARNGSIHFKQCKVERNAFPTDYTIAPEDVRIDKIRKGTYIVDEPMYNSSTITLSCMDYMSKFDRPYAESKLNYPATLNQIVRDACTSCGVSLQTQNFPHDTFLVKEKPNAEAITFREIISWAAQIAGCFCRFDVYGRLEIKWYDQNTLESSNPDSEKLHHITSLWSMDVATDDVVITGIEIIEKNEGSENGDQLTSYLSGLDGYKITIQNNELIKGGAGKQIVSWLGEQLNGFRFRRANITHLSDPTIEAGDVGILTDRKGNNYKIIISSTKYTTGGNQSTNSSATDPVRASAARYSAETKNYVDWRKSLTKEKTEREKALEQLDDKLTNSPGAYTTTETLPGGGSIFYLHDKPKLSDSKMVWKMTSEAWGVSTDGGKTWNAGMTVDGDTIVRILTATGVNADWIDTGTIVARDRQGNIMFSVNIDTGEVFMQALSSLKVGNRNLLLKTNQGTTGWGFTFQNGTFSHVATTALGVNACKFTITTASTGYAVITYNLPNRNEIVPRGTYTLEFDLLPNKEITATVQFMQSNGINNTGNFGSRKFAANVWGHYSGTVTFNSVNIVSQVVYITGLNQAGLEFTIANLIMVEGDKCGSWMPAPADVDNNISETETKLQAQIKVTQDGILNTVNKEITTTKEYADSVASTAQSNAITTASKDATNKANAAQANAIADTTNRLKDYPTTMQMNSAIEQKANAITTTVSATYTTKAETTVVKQNLTKVEQTANKISWLVKSGTSASNFELTDRTATLVSNYINLHGLVQFNGLNTAAQNKINGIETTANTAQNKINSWSAASDTTLINGGKIYTGSITAAQIAAGAITANKVAASAITSDKIAANSITSDKIIASAITSDKIATKAITTDKIAASAITAAQIAAGAITADKINVTSLQAISAKIGGFTIGSKYIANNTTILGSGLNSVYLGTDGISCSSNFKVTSAGELLCSNIKATGGTIGGFSIGQRKLYYETGGTNYFQLEPVTTTGTALKIGTSQYATFKVSGMGTVDMKIISSNTGININGGEPGINVVSNRTAIYAKGDRAIHAVQAAGGNYAIYAEGDIYTNENVKAKSLTITGTTNFAGQTTHNGGISTTVLTITGTGTTDLKAAKASTFSTSGNTTIGGSSSRVGFFGSAGSSKKTNVSKVTGSNLSGTSTTSAIATRVNSIFTQLNNVIDALKAYNLA